MYRRPAPLIGYYYAKGNLNPVDGLADIDDVATEVAAVLDRIPGQG